MVWDFAEGNPFRYLNLSAILTRSRRLGCRMSCHAVPAKVEGQAIQADAQTAVLRRALVATDPPYYDNVGYADLADFFYVWLRRSLGDIYPALMGTMLTPKTDELVADPFRHGGGERLKDSSRTGFERAFANSSRHARWLSDQRVLCVQAGRVGWHRRTCLDRVGDAA